MDDKTCPNCDEPRGAISYTNTQIAGSFCCANCLQKAMEKYGELSNRAKKKLRRKQSGLKNTSV